MVSTRFNTLGGLPDSFCRREYDKKVILFLVFFGHSGAVDFVYRVDSRPSEVIFRDGFASHGNNRNLQQHIRDDSCVSGSRDSTILRLSQILMRLII